MQTKQKICFVITKGNWGGAQKYVYQLATKLPPENFDVSVICGQGEKLPEKLTENKIKVVRLKTLDRNISLIKEWKSFWNLFRLIREERADILHSNSPKAGGLGALAGRILGVKKIIYTAHGWPQNENRPWWQNFLITFFSWLTITLSHKVIVIAERERRQALSMPFVTKNKISLIHNGIEPIEFKSQDAARQNLLSRIPLNNGLDMSKEILDSNSIWIGTVAELHRNKGLEYAIAAVSKISKSINYFILGSGEETEKLQNLIRQNMLENKVFLAGFVDGAEKYLPAFDIFLLPSTKEGLPYTLLEAGLAGLPTVAARVGGVPDIIENNKTGILTTPRSSGEITRAVEYLLDNPETARAYGDALQNKISSEFSLEQMINKTIETYELTNNIQIVVNE